MLLQDNLEGLQHLAIFVTDLNRSCKFYAQFGFTEKLRAQVPEDPEPVRSAMDRAGHVATRTGQCRLQGRREPTEDADPASAGLFADGLCVDGHLLSRMVHAVCLRGRAGHTSPTGRWAPRG